MAAAVKARRPLINIPWTGRYRFRSVALSTATTVARMVDVPGLRQSGRVLRGLAVSFKAPKRISATAQALIDRIDQTISFITESVDLVVDTRDNGQAYVNYLCRTQIFVDKLNKQKEELIIIKNRRYGGRFAHQLDMADELDLCEKMLSETVSQFCLMSSVVTNLDSRTGHQLQPNTGYPPTWIHSTGLPLTWRFDRVRRFGPMDADNRLRLVALLTAAVAYF